MGELREADVHARQPPDRGWSPDDYGERSSRYETHTAAADQLFYQVFFFFLGERNHRRFL